MDTLPHKNTGYVWLAMTRVIEADLKHINTWQDSSAALHYKISVTTPLGDTNWILLVSRALAGSDEDNMNLCVLPRKATEADLGLSTEQLETEKQHLIQLFSYTKV